MTTAETLYLLTVLAAFAVFAGFVVRANNASDDYRKTH